MKFVKKLIIVFLVLIMAFFMFGCREADRVSYNVGKEAGPRIYPGNQRAVHVG